MTPLWQPMTTLVPPSRRCLRMTATDSISSSASVSDCANFFPFRASCRDTVPSPLTAIRRFCAEQRAGQ